METPMNEGSIGNLGLNSHHERGLTSFLKFCRRQRDERLRSISACFNDVITTRLLEETFTKDEVEDLLHQLCEEVKIEVETELLHNAHSDSVLVTSLLTQAQKWHLDLNVDVAQLENQDKLTDIKRFESCGSQMSTSPLKKMNKLTPLQGDKEGPNALLEAHIEKLRHENSELVKKMTELEAKFIALALEKENAQLDHSASEKEINFLRTSLLKQPKEEDVSHLNTEIVGIKHELDETKEHSKDEQERLKKDLEGTEASLKRIQSQLYLAEKELEKKFSHTGVYQNMKKMLEKKNTQLRQLRIKLEKYEPLDEDFKMVDE